MTPTPSSGLRREQADHADATPPDAPPLGRPLRLVTRPNARHTEALLSGAFTLRAGAEPARAELRARDVLRVLST
jgi:hypothetical protein